MRVLLGDMPAVVGGTVRKVIGQEPDIEVVGFAATPFSLLSAAGTLRADVVVVASLDGELPGVATHLVDQYPDIRVVAVTPGGGTALMYALRPRVESLAGSTPAELVAAIRSACQERY